MNNSLGRVGLAAGLLLMAASAGGQLSPGPCGILPMEEAFIIEAWYDLNPSGSGDRIADWTGWTGPSWRSPHAYNTHEGTDFALETGTPLYAIADGEVVAVTKTIPANSGSGYGNFVQIAVDGQSPLGENLNIITAHMMPGSPMSVGQRVSAGELIGYSDNTGNSTSEHLHLESSIRGSSTRCPFYNAHFTYPVMFTPTGTLQVGHVIVVTEDTAAIRTERFGNAQQIGTAHRGQMFFAPYWQSGYYRIFIPNDPSNRGGWVSALDSDEVFEAEAVIQPLPDSGTYIHNNQLQNTYTIREDPDEESAILGTIYWGGSRFVADEAQNGYYRISIPGGTPAWGWVKPGDRMVVYPEIYNPALDLDQRPERSLPITEDFGEQGRSLFGRAKFNRGVVQQFTPPSPGGDDNALFLTDATNFGDGTVESVVVGGPGDRDTYVQCDVYFEYLPSGGGWNRYGIFLRDDGFAGLDDSFEGPGNCYAILFDSDDGRLRAAKIVDASISDLVPSPRYERITGWQTLRIEADGDEIRFYFNDQLLHTAIDTQFPSGVCGIGYSNHRTENPAGRGAWFDNFEAGYLDQPFPDMWLLY